MKKIADKYRDKTFIHHISKALIRFAPRTVEHNHDKTFDNLLYMNIEDEENEITILFESTEDIDMMINKLKQAKTRLRMQEIELGRGNTEEVQ